MGRPACSSWSHRRPQPLRQPAQPGSSARSSLRRTLLFVVGGSSLLDSVDSADEPQHHRQRRRPHPGLLRQVQGRALAFWHLRRNDPTWPRSTDFAADPDGAGAVPNVKAVVPMGINGALVTSGNTVDLTLEELRDVVREGKEQGARPSSRPSGESLKEHVRQIIRVIQGDLSTCRGDQHRARRGTPRPGPQSSRASTESSGTTSTRTPTPRSSSWRTRSPPSSRTRTCCFSATSAPTSTPSRRPSTAWRSSTARRCPRATAAS